MNTSDTYKIVNILLHHSLFVVLQNQYLNIYGLNELRTNNWAAQKL